LENKRTIHHLSNASNKLEKNMAIIKQEIELIKGQIKEEVDKLKMVYQVTVIRG
jgi:hypothetical protein